MEEEYGVVLSLELDDFKKQIANIQYILKDIKEQQIDLDIDTDFDTEEVKTSLDQIEEQLQSLKGSTSDVGQEISNNITDGTEEAGQEVISLAQKIKEYLKNMSPDTKMKIAFVGVAFALGMVVKRMKEAKDRNEKLKQSFKELSKNIVSNVAKGINSLKKFALSLFGIQSAFQAIKKAISSYMSFDQDLSKKMQNTWAGFGSFVAPILEYLITLFQKLLAYTNALVKAFTGIDFIARANSKALNKMGASAGATAKAMKQLGSFDELNNINTDTGSGGAGGGADVNQIELPEVNTDAIDKLKEKIEIIIGKTKEILGKLFEPLQKAWATAGTPLMNGIELSFTRIGELAGSIGKSFMEVWTNGTGQEYIETILALWTSIFNIIGNVAKAINIAWNNAGNGTAIIQNIMDIFTNIAKLALDIAQTIEDWTLTIEFQEMMNTLVWMVERITYYVSKISEDVEKFYKSDIKPVLENALGLISDLITMIGAIWKVAEPVLKPIVNMFKTNIKNSIKAVLDIIDSLITILRGLAQFITGVFQGDWQKAMNGIKTMTKGMINFIISCINTLINGLNKIASPLRLIILGIAKATGKNISFDNVKIPSIPKLKVGTDEVLSEGIAYLHAGEKVVPADVVKGGYSGSDNEETNNLLRELISLIDEKDFEPYIRTEDIGKASVNYINNRKRITGEAIV